MTSQTTEPANTYDTTPYEYYGTPYAHSQLSNHYYYSTVGSDLPDFHKRRRSGDLLPVNSFHQIKNHVTSTGGALDIKRTSDDVQTLESSTMFTSYHSGDHLPFLVAEDELRDLYDYNADLHMQAAVASLMNESSDGLTFLAELGKTIQLFDKIGKRMMKLMSSSNPRDFANLWLEGRFGWRLLYYDIVNLNNLIDSMNQEEHEFYHKRFGTMASIDYDKAREVYVAGVMWYNWDVNASGSYSVRGTVTAKFRPSRIQMSPVDTLWELVPYSFVVDWILGVGAALSAVRLSLLTGDLSLGIGSHISVVSTGTCEGGGSAPHYYGSVSGYSRATQQFTYREPGTLSYIPQISLNLNTGKVVDLIALIIQSFGKH